MEVVDPGHKFLLQNYDGGEPQLLIFMKREGITYPFNVGHYSGTNTQEVLRACISRVKYLQNQIPYWLNRPIIFLLRTALWMFERRAAKRHGRKFSVRLLFQKIEHLLTCPKCGHIECDGNHFLHGIDKPE